MFDQNLRLKPSIRSLECSKTFKPPASRTPKDFQWKFSIPLPPQSGGCLSVCAFLFLERLF